MYVRELVERHGLDIWVWCGKNNYPAFQVLEKLCEKEFRCRYDGGKEFTLNDCLQDYEKIEFEDIIGKEKKLISVR